MWHNMRQTTRHWVMVVLDDVEWDTSTFLPYSMTYQIQIAIKTYKLTMKSATGAVQMEIKMKIMLWNNDEIMMKLS